MDKFSRLSEIEPNLPFSEFNAIKTRIDEVPTLDEAIKILVGHKKISFCIKEKALEKTRLLDFEVIDYAD